MFEDASFRSRRAKILYALQKTLEQIKKENGYTTDVYEVTTSVKSWRDTSEAESPRIYLVDENTLYTYRATQLTERTWTVGIYGVMKNRTQYEMEEFIADIEEILVKNQTLSHDKTKGPGPVAYTRIVNIVTDNQLFSEIEGAQLFKITLNINYVACVNNRTDVAGAGSI